LVYKNRYQVPYPEMLHEPRTVTVLRASVKMDDCWGGGTWLYLSDGTDAGLVTGVVSNEPGRTRGELEGKTIYKYLSCNQRGVFLISQTPPKLLPY